MLVEIVLGGAVVLLLSWMVFGKPSGLPPGRWGFPLFGYVPLGGKYIDDLLMDLHKKYGDIYLWRFGSQLQVYVHDYSLCRQMFASSDFVDRPDIAFMKAHYDVALGIAGSNGAIWHTNRRFSLRQLRDLGMGKSGLASAVQTQALNLLEVLKKSGGKEEPITSALHTAILNIIWKMVANTHFESNDGRHKAFQKLMDDMLAIVDYISIPDMMPWIKYILPTALSRKLFKMDILQAAVEDFFQYFDELIQEHKKNLDPNDPQDLMDAYLIEMNEMAKTDQAALRSEDDLKFLALDMFSAGSDTTTNTLRWIFLYMAAYPEVQRKMQEEIDQVLPKGILATLEDRSSMPYTEAVIHEVLRKSSLANFGVHHSANRDTTLGGYKIPKGTMITSVNAAIHQDPRYWDKPDRVLPERWLSPEGKFVTKKEGFLPFGTGKRVCIGESLARMEILIFTTAVFQNFSIAPPKGKLVDLLPDFDISFTHQPRKQDVVFTLRN